MPGELEAIKDWSSCPLSPVLTFLVDLEPA